MYTIVNNNVWQDINLIQIMAKTKRGDTANIIEEMEYIQKLPLCDKRFKMFFEMRFRYLSNIILFDMGIQKQIIK